MGDIELTKLAFHLKEEAEIFLHENNLRKEAILPVLSGLLKQYCIEFKFSPFKFEMVLRLLIAEYKTTHAKGEHNGKEKD